jgi:hypothetical protein
VRRRAGKVAVDLGSLVKMVVATAGNLSYVFLCVIFFSCLYWSRLRPPLLLFSGSMPFC